MSTPPLMRSLLPQHVAVVEGEVPTVKIGLFPEERALIERAIPKRQQEFATGRLYARSAMAELGITPVPLLKSAGGAPLWPEGVIGSITHCDGYCAAAIVRSPPAKAIGIDVEKMGRITPALESRIASKREIEIYLNAASPAERQRNASLLFSAKEALIKSGHYPMQQSVHYSAGIELELDFTHQSFSLSGEKVFAGRFAFSDDHVTATWLLSV